MFHGSPISYHVHHHQVEELEHLTFTKNVIDVCKSASVSEFFQKAENYKKKEERKYQLNQKHKLLFNTTQILIFANIIDVLQSNTLFEDPEFPADDSSLFYSRRPPKYVEWLRPGVSSERTFTSLGIHIFCLRSKL